MVVSLHWGDEFIDRPSPADVQLARAIVDAGADLIIGHHPHVLRGVERHGRGWIVYSLGNFVCDMLWEEELRETAIAECRLSKNGVEQVRLLPVRINDDSQPVPLQGEGAARLEQRLARLSSALSRNEGVFSGPGASAEYERGGLHGAQPAAVAVASLLPEKRVSLSTPYPGCAGHDVRPQPARRARLGLLKAARLQLAEKSLPPR